MIILVKVAHFMANSVGWRGTCKRLASDDYGCRSKLAERDECFVALFLGVQLAPERFAICPVVGSGLEVLAHRACIYLTTQRSTAVTGVSHPLGGTNHVEEVGPSAR
jgi:hypothetical protein